MNCVYESCTINKKTIFFKCYFVLQDALVLLDLIGTKTVKFNSFFSNTHDLFKRLQKLGLYTTCTIFQYVYILIQLIVPLLLKIHLSTCQYTYLWSSLTVYIKMCTRGKILTRGKIVIERM